MQQFPRTSRQPASLQEHRERSLTQAKDNPGAFLGVPSFIRANVHTAANGGNTGYGEAGFHLGLHVRDLEPHDIELDDWFAIIEAELAPAVNEENGEAVLAWLVRRYPRILSSIPKRRRANFVAGFYRGFAKSAQ